MPHIGINESSQHWFRYWLVADSAPSYYINQCWVIVNWTLRTNFSEMFVKILFFFIHENASGNIVCEMATILSKGINYHHQLDVHIVDKAFTSVLQMSLRIHIERLGKAHRNSSSSFSIPLTERPNSACKLYCVYGQTIMLTVPFI